MAENIAGNSAFLATDSLMAKRGLDRSQNERMKIAIDNVLKKYQSPMITESDAFITACQKYQLNCYLLPSIAGLESTFGRFIYPDSFNAFGWGRGYMKFNNWEDAIDTVAKGLKKDYVGRGAESINEIGPIYSESPTWAIRVSWFMSQFEKEEQKLSLLSTDFPVQL
jgi:hypothetical protein